MLLLVKRATPGTLRGGSEECSQYQVAWCCNPCGYHTNRWKHYLGLKHRASFIERQISEEYVSTEQMTALRNMHFLGTATPVQSIVIEALKQVVTDKLTGGGCDNRTALADIVETMRKHPQEFPLWHTSPTAALFTPPTFENKKENKGYWFWKKRAGLSDKGINPTDHF